MSAKHTPGPWVRSESSKHDPEWIHAPEQFAIAAVPPGPQREANARLIAAAPELLEALKDARRYIAADLDENAKRWVRAIDGVIAKAEGSK